MRDTSSGKLEHHYQSWDHFTSQLKSQPGSNNDVINQSYARLNLTYGIWNIHKDIDAYESLQQMDLDTKVARKFTSQRLICYQAKNDNNECCINPTKDSKKRENSAKRNCDPKSVTPKSSYFKCPLNKTLQNVNKALSFEKCCTYKINELMETQKELRKQINLKEKKEIETSNRIKEAQPLWNTMETYYKTKIQNALEKVNIALDGRKEIDSSVRKWRLNKKDLEFQLTAKKKHCNDFKELIKVKVNKFECTRNDVKNIKQKIEATTNQIDIVNECMKNKKKASNDRVKKNTAEINKFKKLVHEENNNKRDKQIEGNKYANETRDDLHKIYRIMLQMKLENEHLRTQKEAIKNEIDRIKINMEQIKQNFRNNDKRLPEEIANLNSEIATLKVTCTSCAQCVDTSDVKNFCSDCPRCIEERSRTHDGVRLSNIAPECICVNVKEKLLDNVFKNMHTVLKNQIDTAFGRDTANAVLCFLKKSRDGKLDEKTKNILQDFILRTIENNLDTTIIGGAMKTRYEMKSDTYNKLMLCLGYNEVPRAPIEDAGAVLSKDPCRCSSIDCIKASAIISNVCPNLPRQFDTKMSQCVADEVIWRPDKKTSFGTNCCMRAEAISQCNTLKYQHNTIKDHCNTIKEFKRWRQTPCNNDICPNNMKNVRAAQCKLGDETLPPLETKVYKANVPYVSEVLTINNQEVSKYGTSPKKPNARYNGLKYQIEEPSGRYAEKIANLHIRCAIYKSSPFVQPSRCIMSRA